MKRTRPYNQVQPPIFDRCVAVSKILESIHVYMYTYKHGNWLVAVVRCEKRNTPTAYVNVYNPSNVFQCSIRPSNFFFFFGFNIVQLLCIKFSHASICFSFKLGHASILHYMFLMIKIYCKNWICPTCVMF